MLYMKESIDAAAKQAKLDRAMRRAKDRTQETEKVDDVLKGKEDKESTSSATTLAGDRDQDLADVLEAIGSSPPAAARGANPCFFLVDCAREQQEYNRDPAGPSYYRLGPGYARLFDLDRLTDSVDRNLEKYDCVRIDVRYYTAEQRAEIRSRLVGPRVSMVGEDAVNVGGAG